MPFKIKNTKRIYFVLSKTLSCMLLYNTKCTIKLVMHIKIPRSPSILQNENTDCDGQRSVYRRLAYIRMDGVECV